MLFDRLRTDEHVVVLSHGLWKRRFGGGAGASDSTLTLNGERFRIVGVAPEGFTGTILGFAADLWVPVTVRTKVRFATDLISRGARGYFALARLQPTVTLAQARAALEILALRSVRQKRAGVCTFDTAHVACAIRE